MGSLGAVMSVATLAKMGNISRRRMRRLLEQSKVPMRKVGTTYIVFLSDVKLALPGLWESICEYRKLGL